MSDTLESENDNKNELLERGDRTGGKTTRIFSWRDRGEQIWRERERVNKNELSGGRGRQQE